MKHASLDLCKPSRRAIEQAFDVALALRSEPEEVAAWAKAIDFRDCDRRVPTPRHKRKPNIRRMVAAAEKTGKTVTSITMPDGAVLHFGEPESTDARQIRGSTISR